jgi:hypothetical protein
MTAGVERVVILADSDGSGLLYRRYVVTTDGQRVDDRRFKAGSFSGKFIDTRGLSEEELRAEARERAQAKAREQHSRASDRGLRSLVAALQEAGITVTTGALRAAPVSTEFTAAALAEVDRRAMADPMFGRRRPAD